LPADLSSRISAAQRDVEHLADRLTADAIGGLLDQGEILHAVLEERADCAAADLELCDERRRDVGRPR
jgi:hypothetical protein